MRGRIDRRVACLLIVSLVMAPARADFFEDECSVDGCESQAADWEDPPLHLAQSVKDVEDTDGYMSDELLARDMDMMDILIEQDDIFRYFCMVRAHFTQQELNEFFAYWNDAGQSISVWCQGHWEIMEQLERGASLESNDMTDCGYCWDHLDLIWRIHHKVHFLAPPYDGVVHGYAGYGLEFQLHNEAFQACYSDAEECLAICWALVDSKL